MKDKQIQQKHKKLNYSYAEFQKRNKNLQNVKFDKFFILDQIGEGGYAKIYRGMNEQTNQEVAIKVLDIRIVQQEKDSSTKRVRNRLIEEESKLMMKINFPHVVKCYECFQNRDLKIMVIEYCNQGTLSDKITLAKKIPEDEAISILKQILKGIGECHKQQIIHRDLKPENILIHNGEIKIADFGFSKKLALQNENQQTKNTMLGTPTTMAPQVLKKEPYGLKADIWSIGIIFFWMIFGVCPFKINRQPEEILNTMKQDLAKSCDQYNGIKASQKVRKFLKEVLVMDVEKRLGWKEVLNHEIFKNDSENLPNNFYRQVQMKKDDLKLFNMERDFLYQSRRVTVDESFSEFSEPKKQNHQLVSKDKVNQQKNQSQVWSVLEQEKQSGYISKKYFSINERSTSIKEKQAQKKQPQKKEREQLKLINRKRQVQIERQKQVKEPLISLKELKTQKIEQKSAKKIEQSVCPKKPSFRSLRIQDSSQNLNSPRSNTRRIAYSPVYSPVHSEKSSLSRFKGDEAKKTQKQLQNEEHKQLKKIKEIRESDSMFKNSVRNLFDQKMQQNNGNKSQQLFEVSPEEVLKRKYLINREEDELYIWARKNHVQCLKTETIFNNIVKMIQSQKTLNMESRQVIQLMYLLCTRCRNNMSPIYQEYKKRKHSQVLKQISGLVEKLYKEVTAKFYHYSDLLTKKENQKITILKDLLKSKFSSDSFKEKDKYLTGVESMTEFIPSNREQQMQQKQQKNILSDYSKEDQIAYTNKYIKEIMKKFTEHKKAKIILPHMLNFAEICSIKADDSTTHNFKEKLQYILSGQKELDQSFSLNETTVSH